MLTEPLTPEQIHAECSRRLADLRNNIDPARRRAELDEMLVPFAKGGAYYFVPPAHDE